MAITYRDAGVDVEAGYEAVRLMKRHVETTHDDHVLHGIGHFGGLYDIAAMGIEDPVLVSGTDGVGTKLKLAFILDRHDSIGIDAVAMCVNDIICLGARPLFFLDYIATPRLEPWKVEQIVKGVSLGCQQAGCALIGGETAEMPGFYAEGEYDIAGFSTGIVSRKRIIDGSGILPGDVLIGLASSGIHSNGYSLVRRLFPMDRQALEQDHPTLGCTLGEALLRPTRIYVKPVLELTKQFPIKGIAHITGGGFIENIPRMLPEGMQAQIDLGSWPVLSIFTLMQQLGNIPRESIYNTFNMGIGMVLAVDKAIASDVLDACQAMELEAYPIGKITQGQGGITLCG